MAKTKITFLGATETVTGSKYLVDNGKTKILIDCGLFQGYKELRLRNWAPLPFDPKDIDAVILTHAHIDHSGYLPLLVRNGFNGPIYCTSATKSLCEILLPDSGYLQEEEARHANKYGSSKHKPALPLYTMGDAEYALKYFQVVDSAKYHKINADYTFKFTPAGHILGASFITLKSQGKSIVFSGDVGRMHDPVMRPPGKITEADYIVVESTYGNREHETEDVMQIFADIVNKTVKKGGVLLVPAFAVGRTQLLLYYLHQLKKKKKIPDIPIYMDSPMAINASHIFCDYFEEHKLSRSETRAVCASATYINTREGSKQLDEETFPKIIISASGMATGGRVLHHLIRFLDDSRNTILFAGYQSEGTRGDRLVRGETEVRIFGNMVPVKAEIIMLANLSAHADYNGVLHWLSQLKTAPQQVFVTHGSSDATNALREKIEAKFQWKCVIPKYKETFKL